MHRLMIVDDEKNVLAALLRVCRGKKLWEIETYSDPQEALHRAQKTNFDLFLSDYRMPKMNGVQFLKEIKDIQPDAMRIILSGQTDREGLMAAINEAEIYRFLDKPWQDQDVLITLQQALNLQDILSENRILANQVRKQKRELVQRKLALDKYKDRHPDLFKVEWSADGSIILDNQK